MDRGLYNIVVLLDLKKAFDTYEILLRKFERYGFGNKALDLLSNYLTNRTQRCQLNGMLSDQREITCASLSEVYLALNNSVYHLHK